MSATFHPYIGAFIWISMFLALGTFLRAKIPFLQKGLVPAALIGGLIGFAFMNTGLVGMPTAEGWMPISTDVFGVLVYHLFAFGFVGIGLMQQDNCEKTAAAKTNWIRSGALWMALIYCLVYAVQGVTGKTIFELCKLVTGGEFFTGLGYLVSSGYSQSPGAAHAFGTIWQAEYGIQGAGSVGLAFGAMGFLCAICFGIPLANRGIKNGWISEKSIGALPESLRRGLMGKNEHEPCAYFTTHPANIDSFAFHFAIMAVLYGVGYVFALAWSVYMPKGVSGLGFGLLYTWGMIAGLIVRKTLAKMKTIHIIDNHSTKRITSTTIDYMICAAFMGIAMSDIQAIFLPFILTVIVAGALTYVVTQYFAKRLPEYGFERGIAVLGCYTGTAATGILLLRIVDPDFKSPAAVELAIMNVFILPIIQLVYINLPFVPSEGSMMLPIFIAYIIAMPIALFALKFVRKPNW